MVQYDLPQTKAARGFQGRAAGQLVGRLLSPILRRRGFRNLPILERWHEIVGAQLAAVSRPERIRHHKDGATLTIRVEGAMAVEVQHMSPLILERINSHFGGAAIARLTIIQGHLPMSPKAQDVRPLSPQEIATAHNDLSDFGENKLKTALARLGAYVRRES